MNEDIHYTLIRSRRLKRISITVNELGDVIAKAPVFMPERAIKEFINSKSEWIKKSQQKMQNKRASLPQVEQLTPEEFARLKKDAKRVFSERAAIYAERIGVSYNRIAVRFQRTRWGSCSANGNLNFNGLLLLAPLEVLDSVVVHELCHLIHMNHSDAFYAEVYKAYPDYDKYHGWLKENGSLLSARLPIERQ